MGVRSLQISTCMADVYLMIIWVSAAKDGEQNSWQQESSDWDLADSHPRSFRVSHLPFIFLFLAERRYAARVFNVSSDATTEWLGCLALRNYLYGHDTSLEYFIVCREARFIVLPIINLNYTHIHTHTHICSVWTCCYLWTEWGASGWLVHCFPANTNRASRWTGSTGPTRRWQCFCCSLSHKATDSYWSYSWVGVLFGWCNCHFHISSMLLKLCWETHCLLLRMFHPGGA